MCVTRSSPCFVCHAFISCSSKSKCVTQVEVLLLVSSTEKKQHRRTKQRQVFEPTSSNPRGVLARRPRLQIQSFGGSESYAFVIPRQNSLRLQGCPATCIRKGKALSSVCTISMVRVCTGNHTARKPTDKSATAHKESDADDENGHDGLQERAWIDAPLTDWVEQRSLP